MVWQWRFALDGRQERWAWEVDCAFINGAMGFCMGLLISRRILLRPGGTGAMDPSIEAPARRICVLCGENQEIEALQAH
jgi:hypothetical protein